MGAEMTVAAVVGIDGCGKSSTSRDALDLLADSRPVAGVGEIVLQGSPGKAVEQRVDIPLSGSARFVGRIAKGVHRPTLYKDLKFLDVRGTLISTEALSALQEQIPEAKIVSDAM